MLDDEILAVNGESVAGATATQELLVSAVRAKQEVKLTLKRQPSSNVNVTPPQTDIFAEPQTDMSQIYSPQLSRRMRLLGG